MSLCWPVVLKCCSLLCMLVVLLIHSCVDELVNACL
jgi:hypothetical protein